MQSNLSETKLNKIARENYSILVRYCTVLREEGYWEQPEQILKKSIQDMLDIYLQTCLVTIALQCSEHINEAQLDLIINLTHTNPLSINVENGIDEEVKGLVQKMSQSTPILLQLVSLRDTNKETTMAGLFFDAILNILLVMAYLSTVTATIYMRCLQQFCEKAAVFVRNAKNQTSVVDEKYLFRKICVQDLEGSTQTLIDAGEDFDKYKKDSLYYSSLTPKKPSEPVATKQDTLSRKVQANEEIIQEAKPYHEENLTQQVQTSKLDALLQELNELVGLEDVKKEINSLINLIKVKKLREKYCLPEMDMSYHMVFSGSPGTGKTTVARLVAQIYKELGLLSKGNLVETDRAGLVAGYVGQTAIKVKEVVDRAIGGVLFIDEAYSLSNAGNANDFGSEAIDTLVKLMEDNREDLVVIVAGYTQEMKQFLAANTGLVSRFNKFIEFKDYTNDELIAILNGMAKHNGFVIQPKAIERVEDYLLHMNETNRQSFGNARGIRNLFERMVVVQANRVVTYMSPSKEQLTAIEKEDVIELI